MKIDFSDKELAFLMRVLVQNFAENESDYTGSDSSYDHMYGICDQLIGKIVSSNYPTRKKYEEARKSRYEKEPINKGLFMGSGYHSLLNMNRLHKRLQFAFSELSAIQQNGGMGTEFDEQMDKECTQNIKDVVKDILVAFGLKPEDLT